MEGVSYGINVRVVKPGERVLVPRDVARRERERGVIRVHYGDYCYSGELPERFRRPVGRFRVYDCRGRLIGIGIEEWRTLLVPDGLPKSIVDRMKADFYNIVTGKICSIPVELVKAALAVAAALGVEGIEVKSGVVLVDGERVENILLQPRRMQELLVKMCQAIRKVGEKEGKVPVAGIIRVRIGNVTIEC